MVQADPTLARLALVFFGLFLVVIGYLVARSAFAPRWLGMWLAFAGVAWCTIVLLPGAPYAARVVLMVFGGLSEVALLLWLVVLAVRR